MCCSIFLVLFFGLFLWLTTTYLFVIGGLSDKVICQTLEDPENTESLIYDTANQALDKLIRQLIPSNKTFNETFTYDKFIQACKENKSLYEALDLHQIFDLENTFNYKEFLKINSNITFDEIKNKLKVKINEGVKDAINKVIIDQVTKTKIRNTAKKFVEKSKKAFDETSKIDSSKMFERSDLEKLKDNIQKVNDFTTGQGITLDGMTKAMADLENIERKFDKDLKGVKILKGLKATKNLMENYKMKILYKGTCNILCAVDRSFPITDKAIKYIETDAPKRLHLAAEKSVDRMVELGQNYLNV